MEDIDGLWESRGCIVLLSLLCSWSETESSEPFETRNSRFYEPLSQGVSKDRDCLLNAYFAATCTVPATPHTPQLLTLLCSSLCAPVIFSLSMLNLVGNPRAQMLRMNVSWAAKKTRGIANAWLLYLFQVVLKRKPERNKLDQCPINASFVSRPMKYPSVSLGRPTQTARTPFTPIAYLIG
jgi:hypothetical protein